jgi:tetratricopeptide (TPR) repeat protein
MKGHPQWSNWTGILISWAAIIALGILTFSSDHGHQNNARHPDQQTALEEQDRNARAYANDQQLLRKLMDKYPSRSREVIELYLRGSWLCINNGGYPDTDAGALTKERRALANDMGINYIRQAVQMDPAFPQVYLALGEFLNMKSIQLSNHDLTAESDAARKEALESYQKASQLDPTNPQTYFGIARTMPSDRLDERIGNLLMVEKLDPSYPDVHAFLASNYEMKGDFEKATEELIKRLDGPGNHIEILDHLVRVVEKSKQYSQLLHGYSKLVDTDPYPRSFDQVLFAISPFRPKMLKEGPSLNLESLVDHKALAEFLITVGTKAAQKQQEWVSSPLQQAYKRSAERDSSLASQKPPQDLSGVAEQFFRKALELDPSKTSEIRKIAESSQLDELKKFARTLPQ